MFLNNVNKTQLCRRFEEFRPHPEYQILNFYSDASLNENLGYGAIFNDSWIVGQWPAKFIANCKPSIKFLELFTLTMALTVWSEHAQLKDTHVAIYCDNEA